MGFLLRVQWQYLRHHPLGHLGKKGACLGLGMGRPVT